MTLCEHLAPFLSIIRVNKFLQVVFLTDFENMSLLLLELCGSEFEYENHSRSLLHLKKANVAKINPTGLLSDAWPAR